MKSWNTPFAPGSIFNDPEFTFGLGLGIGALMVSLIGLVAALLLS